MRARTCIALLLLVTVSVTSLLRSPVLLAQPAIATATGQSEEFSDATIEAYRSELASLSGTYDESSGEIYLSLANALWEFGALQEATFAFQEALQAARINGGLATDAQFTVLNQFNGLLYETQDWEQLDTNMYIAADIARRIYSPADARYIRAMTELASWKIRAFQTRVYRPVNDRSVQEAANIYRILMRDLEAAGQLKPELHVKLLSSRGLAYFYSAKHVAQLPVEVFKAVSPASQSIQQCIPTILSVDSGVQPSASACNAGASLDPEFYAAQQREKNNTVRRHLGNMRQSFMEAIDVLEEMPDVSERELAIAVLNLGDANLLAGDHARARTQYGRAWDMLEDSLELRNELMGQPVKVLEAILDEIPRDPRMRSGNLPVNVSFDVETTGEITNLNLEAPAEVLTQETVGAIGIRLDQTSYRPRIVDGRPVVSRLTVPASEL